MTEVSAEHQAWREQMASERLAWRRQMALDDEMWREQMQADRQASQGQARADRRRHLTILSGMLGGFAVMVAGFAVLILHRWPGDALARACDRQVAALLTSQNLVDVQRAGILVRELNCDVVHRIARAEAGS